MATCLATHRTRSGLSKQNLMCTEKGAWTPSEQCDGESLWRDIEREGEREGMGEREGESEGERGRELEREIDWSAYTSAGVLYLYRSMGVG
jgi:hypothetical protein